MGLYIIHMYNSKRYLWKDVHQSVDYYVRNSLILGDFKLFSYIFYYVNSLQKFLYKF